MENRQEEVKNSIGEMEKPKNLYVWAMDMNYGGGMWVGGGVHTEGNKGGKTGQL